MLPSSIDRSIFVQVAMSFFFTQLHFNHLRFIYELRGSGLLGPDGLVMPVKYLIYNDPDSDAIFVKDTASLNLEILESSTRINSLLGEVTLSAYQVQS